jgi:hypothetical protein
VVLAGSARYSYVSVMEKQGVKAEKETPDGKHSSSDVELSGRKDNSSENDDE